MNPYLIVTCFVLFAILLIEIFFHVKSIKVISKRERINKQLVNLFSDLTKCDDKELVYSKILKVFVEMFPNSEKGSFALIDEKKKNQMYFVSVYGYSQDLLKIKLIVEDTYLYQENRYSSAAIIKKPLKYIERNLDADKIEILMREKGNINQTLATPIYAYGKVSGVISVDAFGSNRFRKGDVELIEYFINRISYLLEYFVTRSRMDYDIDIDSLTQIYSRKYFLELLEKSISERRKDEKLALIIFDIDDFKKVNDTYGHIIGDQVLYDFGQKLLNNCEEDSCVCGRLGGDEFGIISKNKDVKFILSKISNLRKELRRKPYKKNYPIDISYGFVIIEGDSKTYSKELIDRADKLMYQLKKQRKSRKRK